MQDTITTAPVGLLACTSDDVPRDGSVITRTVGGRSVALARRSADEDTIVAFDSRCPHMQGPLRFGRVVEGEVVCPWHFLRFDVVTGDAMGCDKTIMHLATYPVEQQGEQVYVKIAPGAGTPAGEHTASA